MILVAPTESDKLKALGMSSQLPEAYGADILFSAHDKLIGIQRKAFPSDFLASLYDGRLYKELAQMKALDIAVLMIEGRMSWTLDGELVVDRGARFTRSQFRNLCHSIQFNHEVAIEWSDSLDDTLEAVRSLVYWAEKDEHVSLSRRSKCSDSWGTVSSGREWGVHILQSFPGIGPHLAGAIYDHHGGVPLKWAVEKEQLGEVKGLGKLKVESLWNALKGESKGEVSEVVQPIAKVSDKRRKRGKGNDRCGGNGQ